MKAEIISIGSEILLGELTDTDSSYLASQLLSLGITLDWVSQVGDVHAHITKVLRRAWGRSDLVLTTGGLGPTDDDITRDAIADVLGEKLTANPDLEKALRERFAKWNMSMPLSNLRQAMTIPSATPIPNEQGTAPGWWVEKDGRTLITMPGPQRELQAMWQKEVQPRLERRATAIIVTRAFKTFGLSEAAVGEMVSPLFRETNPVLGIYAKADGIHLRLAAQGSNREQAEQLIAPPAAQIRALLGDYIWGLDSDTLESAVARLLTERRLSLAIMEDCSGGWLTASLSDIPGSTAFLKGGLTAQTDGSKVALGVDAAAISCHGAISPEVAEAMASAAQNLFGADIGLGITGVAETPSNPSGIAYIGLSGTGGKRSVGVTRGKRRATLTALTELRKQLIGERQIEK